VLGRPQAAADAYARAHELAPDDPAILAAWADALLAAHDADEPAVLSDTFVEVMEKLYALDPTSLRALWFLGVKALQDGEPAEARGHWETLLAQLDEGSEEYALIEQRLQDLESE
jgi:cytochrome c-type biogenesis protein CcmH